jgi:hypothetical protein
MLKLRRKQVMITGWLDDFIKMVSQKYDISYSEVLRLCTSYFFAITLAAVNPKRYKMSITPQKIALVLKQRETDKRGFEESRKLMADIYWETKKILELRTEELKKSE